MKCEIVKDLLPSLCDGVCSKESEEEILSHIESCEECKRVYKSYKVNIDPGSVNKDAAPRNPFIRVRKALFKSRLIMAALGLVLLVFLCIAGVLLYWQHIRVPDRPSFETIALSNKAEKLMKKLAKGDIDYFLNNISYLKPDSDSSIIFMLEAEQYLRDRLTEFYEAELKNNDVEIIKGHSGYGIGSAYSMKMIPSATVTLKINSGKSIEFLFGSDGGEVSVYRISDDSAGYGNPVVNNLLFAMNPSEPSAFIHLQIINEIKIAEANNDFYFVSLSGDFTSSAEEAERFRQNHIRLLESGDMFCESFDYNNFAFDRENERFTADLNLIFLEKSSGKRIMYKRTIVINNYSSYAIVPEYEPIVIDDGVSSENRQNLINLFA